MALPLDELFPANEIVRIEFSKEYSKLRHYPLTLHCTPQTRNTVGPLDAQNTV